MLEKRRAAAPGSSIVVSGARKSTPVGATSVRRTILWLASGSFGGTQRSSVIHAVTPSQSRCRDARDSYVARGVDPPERPRATPSCVSISRSMRSAAHAARATASGTMIGFTRSSYRGAVATFGPGDGYLEHDMLETISIDTPHGPTTAIVSRPHEPQAAPILLAHGAGLGQRHMWMEAVRDRCVDRGHIVMTFDYAYMEAGRKAPDRLPKLLDVHEAAARHLKELAGPSILIGKSMGGRVGSHLVAQDRCVARGLVYLGYPLVAMGETVPRNTDHLVSITFPQLFISGSRDRMGPVTAIETIAEAVPHGNAVFIEDGDHSLIPLKRSGRTMDDSLDIAVESIEHWIRAEV